MRSCVAVLIAAGTAALGALILGEYEFTATTGIVAGAVVGVLLGEIIVSGGRWRGPAAAVVAAGLAAGSIGWAGWIDSGEGLEPFPDGAWYGSAVAAIVAGARASGIRRDPTGDQAP